MTLGSRCQGGLITFYELLGLSSDTQRNGVEFISQDRDRIHWLGYLLLPDHDFPPGNILVLFLAYSGPGGT
jgi:hypothetical protein